MNSPGAGARFVVFEGGESAGKSTQASRLAIRRGALLTFEPGDTPLGRELRRLLLSSGAPMGDRAEALLLAADRAQHVEEVIRPALAAGTDVVCDRYAASYLAYQGYGRGLDLEFLRGLSTWAADELAPDLFVLLDICPERARTRLPERRKKDRFEASGDLFQKRVREGYLELAAAQPELWVVVDADRDPEAVSESVQQAVVERLGW